MADIGCAVNSPDHAAGRIAGRNKPRPITGRRYSRRINPDLVRIELGQNHFFENGQNNLKRLNFGPFSVDK